MRLVESDKKEMSGEQEDTMAIILISPKKNSFLICNYFDFVPFFVNTFRFVPLFVNSLLLNLKL